MSISYEAVVQAVGPADKIALFKEKVLALKPPYSSYGIEQQIDLPNCVGFYENTSGSARDVSYRWPELFYMATNDPMTVDGIVLRVFLITECIYEMQLVIEDNQTAFQQRSELDMGAFVAPDEDLPEIVHEAVGDATAWQRACARFGVEYPFSALMFEA